jgi:hypothetical protein
MQRGEDVAEKMRDRDRTGGGETELRLPTANESRAFIRKRAPSGGGSLPIGGMAVTSTGRVGWKAVEGATPLGGQAGARLLPSLGTPSSRGELGKGRAGEQALRQADRCPPGGRPRIEGLHVNGLPVHIRPSI